MHPPAFEPKFTTDPVEFLAWARNYLEAEPVISTVVATTAHRAARGERIAGEEGAPRWWLIVHDATGAVVGAGMRTHPDPPHPLFLLPMPEGAGIQLAAVLHERGEEVGGVNGALPTVREFATASAGGATIRTDVHTRLFELTELVPPRSVPGFLRSVEEADLDRVAPWLASFGQEAAEQAGRRVLQHQDRGDARRRALERIRRGLLWFWVDEHGTPVHLVGANPPAFGVARVGPVFTPRSQRGKGYASAAVAEVSALLGESGDRVCLFTDQANPTSNALYQRLGYRPVVDMANLVIG